MSDYPNVKINGLVVGPREPVRVMSVINLSPESFYKGAIADSVDRFHEMIEVVTKEGADLIDIGGVSTAPKQVYGTSDISIDDEIMRVKDALNSIDMSKYPPISIDTTSSKVAKVAIDLGVALVNDVSGLHSDSNMGNLVAGYELPIVLMARCDSPCESVQSSIESLMDSLRIANKAGIEADRIILDPGIGFGKPAEVDVQILRELGQFIKLNHPLLVGVSRKAFIGHILNQPNPEDRLLGSLVATTFAVSEGANIIRTHDVAKTKIAIKMGEAFRGKIQN
ncbi:MAG: dihydropteroate synthase [Candidatus Thorarchaeota archaeon]